MRTVVCFGDSITHGLISSNYVEMLERRFSADDLRFVNAGVDNDHIYNLYLRLDSVIVHQPDYVTILAGTNDVIATLNPIRGIIKRLEKWLPRQPDLPWYCETLTEIIRQLKKHTKAKLAVASIPVLGEDLDSESNWQVYRFNAAIKEIAREEQIAYLPVTERQTAYLNSITQAGRPYWASLLLTLEMTIGRILFRQSLDTFSRRKGFVLLTDGVHMNSKGASIIADEIESFLRASFHT